MQPNEPKKNKSAFNAEGFKVSVEALKEEIRALYLADSIPWVVGYSGGKDSTAVLQLIWLSLSELDASQRSKTVHVITTDTLVENPVVAAWVTKSLDSMKGQAEAQGLPIVPHRLTPEVSNTFWVNLIGKGYPAPRPKFRWCTERLKIKPSNAFIHNVVRENGEAIVILGTRKAESAARASVMKKLELKRVRERLSPNTTLPNSLVYSPIEEWSNDDVWLYLMQVKNPWGYSNKDLLTMYQGANPDGECPLVVDTSTPSCGDSRFGCWVCTLVDKDKSMTAMIQNDQEKEWMYPMLQLRNELDLQDDRHLRDFRRLTGAVQLFNDRTIPGPYTQSSREHWLRRVLEVQTTVRQSAPPGLDDIELITLDELQEIRRIWVVEKHELEDSLPKIYEEVTSSNYPGKALSDNTVFGAEEMDLLRDVCANDNLHFELARELLDVEQRFRTQARRSGLYDALEKAFKRSFFDDADDALNRALHRRNVLSSAGANQFGSDEGFLPGEAPNLELEDSEQLPISFENI